ncbi:MAG TPA: lactate utilization protein [Anaeromyxobacter sp.]|nr:lactate utilization protein [Anaeromyxobacter sp.]
MFATFRSRAEAANAEVHRFTERAAALRFVEDLLRSEGVAGPSGATAVWSDRGFLSAAEREALAARVPGLGFQVTPESAAGARLGVTQVDWAVAETGSLVVTTEAVAERLASSLPEIHLALADPTRMLPTLSALLRELGPSPNRFLALITGPSRTADIERVLTIGVHGPRRLVIVFVEGLAGRN